MHTTNFELIEILRTEEATDELKKVATDELLRRIVLASKYS